ncbi:hypothetical protein HMPREF9154_2924 [Arachnia propionica F0230a]|nr:hypothetical protein HMPREF9154_2924 [Arachnia propionica F0230a]
MLVGGSSRGSSWWPGETDAGDRAGSCGLDGTAKPELHRDERSRFHPSEYSFRQD